MTSGLSICFFNIIGGGVGGSLFVQDRSPSCVFCACVINIQCKWRCKIYIFTHCVYMKFVLYYCSYHLIHWKNKKSHILLVFGFSDEESSSLKPHTLTDQFIINTCKLKNMKLKAKLKISAGLC